MSVLFDTMVEDQKLIERTAESGGEAAVAQTVRAQTVPAQTVRTRSDELGAVDAADRRSASAGTAEQPAAGTADQPATGAAEQPSAVTADSPDQPAAVDAPDKPAAGDAPDKPGAAGSAAKQQPKRRTRLPRGRGRVLSWLDFIPVRDVEDDDVPHETTADFARDRNVLTPKYGRAGFEAGGPADTMTPCEVLASLTGQASGRMNELTDDELVGVMRAARRVQSWQAAMELQAVRELTCRRLAEPEGLGPHPGERAAAEIAAALTLTGHAAGDWAALAAGVGRLEAVRGALTAGQIDLARAKTFVDELALLDALLANCLATSVMLGAAGLTVTQLRARLRRAVMAADPAAIRRRQAAAQGDARIEIWGEPSGNAVLAGRELPPAGVLAASRHLTALAQACKKAGAPGGLNQIRARVYLALLSGRDPATVFQAAPANEPEPGSAADEDQRSSADNELTTPDASGSGAACPGEPNSREPGSESESESESADASGQVGGADADGGCTQQPAIAWPSGLRGTINLTMPLSAWLGLSNRPGQVTGYGPADAWTCRYLSDRLADQPGTQYCVTVTTADGQPLGHACASDPPRRAGREGNHAAPGPHSGPPAESGSSAHATGATGPPSGGGPAPPVLAPVRDWLHQLTIHWLEPGASCDHAMQTPRYRPGRKLAHLVRVLNPSCTAPGCRRPAQQSDLDHIEPYDQGGRTCTCNLQPGCRHHHRLKQQPGWHVQMIRPGLLTWRLPHGRSYTTTAEPYPV